MKQTKNSEKQPLTIVAMSLKDKIITWMSDVHRELMESRQRFEGVEAILRKHSKEIKKLKAQDR